MQGFRLSTPVMALALTMLALRSAAQDEPSPADAIRDAVLFRGQLIALHEDGRFVSWSADTGRPDVPRPLAPLPNGARRLATDSTDLYAAGVDAVWWWSIVSHAWTKVGAFDPHGEEVQGLVLVGGKPIVVLGTRVLSPADEREFKVPDGKGQMVRVPPLRVLALHAGAPTLWIGTGYGEWGGELMGLDLGTGAWLRHAEELTYVTGIAQSTPGELTVTWAMSHMGHADSRLRLHGLDGSVKSEGAERPKTYLQGLAWSPFDKTFYAVDTGDFVSLDGEQVARLGTLDGDIYQSEPHAVGVAPGIVALLPAAEKSVFIVPAQGLPWRWHASELVRLEPPGPTDQGGKPER